MPNITVYANDEIYIQFLELSDETRVKLRDAFLNGILHAVEKGEKK